MGFIAGCILTVAMIWGVYSFVTDPKARVNITKEFRDDPALSAFTMFGTLSCMVFMWGVFVPVVGEISLNGRRDGLKIWQAVGLCCLAWAFIGIVGSYVKRKR